MRTRPYSHELGERRLLAAFFCCKAHEPMNDVKLDSRWHQSLLHSNEIFLAIRTFIYLNKYLLNILNTRHNFSMKVSTMNIVLVLENVITLA